MSLVSTLGKMAVGMIVAKGVSKMVSGGSPSGGGLGGLLGSLAGGGGGSQGGGLGGLLGSLSGGGSQQQSGGGLGDLLGNLSNSQQRGGSAGGLGDLLGSLTGGQSSGGGFGGLSSMLGGGAAGAQQGGGLGGILDSLGGGSQAGAGGLGGMLNDALQGKAAEPSNEQELQAEVMLRAMISAAKADGDIDEAEQQKISEHLGDITADELELVRSIMSEPNDIDALVNSIPKGMEQQAYFMSLLAIDLDSQAEAEYLHKLSQGLGISQEMSNNIHEKLGAPVLYS
ncbi:MAG: DUF533 domain-containing protein (Fragment) [uncultured Thiotrichaceae bacterium]|uniref:DUF533 domain-containing protein n=1 Tax=uncultured Thiotrichaceae bacterium TaxID=298394 RepID=A0A6S6S522_9GAMM